MLSLKNIRDAEKSIETLVKRTPLVFSQHLSQLCGGEIYLKLENQQITKSFKIRGALNKMLHLSSEERERGVITASAGNHAQAIAIAAENLGIKAKVVVPCTTPEVKIRKIQKHDLELVIFGNIYDEAERKAIKLAKTEGLTYVSPYNDRYVIAGQGTIGLEVLEDLPTLDTIVVPVGGGGLISGIAIAVKSVKSTVDIIGVQSMASPVMYESLKTGKIVDIEVEESIADGLHGGIESNSITFNLVQKFVDRLLLVEENCIRKAIKLLAEKEKQIVEGAGATPIALIIEKPKIFEGKRAVAIMSGGNIEKKLLKTILSSKSE
jgi:threonine dehydratase